MTQNRNRRFRRRKTTVQLHPSSLDALEDRQFDEQRHHASERGQEHRPGELQRIRVQNEEKEEKPLIAVLIDNKSSSALEGLRLTCAILLDSIFSNSHSHIADNILGRSSRAKEESGSPPSRYNSPSPSPSKANPWESSILILQDRRYHVWSDSKVQRSPKHLVVGYRCLFTVLKRSNRHRTQQQQQQQQQHKKTRKDRNNRQEENEAPFDACP